MRTLLCYCFFFLLLALLSCRQEEDTPPPISPVPVIAFKGLTRYTSWAPARPMTGYVGDSINLVIDYQDGDGDLGLSFKDLDSLQDLYDDGKIDDIQVGDTLRARVHIADRARNLSNTIKTTEFVFMK
jgi:hypothetical protein